MIPGARSGALGNILLRIFPEHLFPCVGARMVRAADASVSKEERDTAKRELAQLERSIKRFFDPDFLAQLLLKSSTRRAKDPQLWSGFLRKTARLPLSDRCVHYLALRYDVESSAIQHAIWPRTKPAK